MTNADMCSVPGGYCLVDHRATLGFAAPGKIIGFSISTSACTAIEVPFQPSRSNVRVFGSCSVTLALGSTGGGSARTRGPRKRNRVGVRQECAREQAQTQWGVWRGVCAGRLQRLYGRLSLWLRRRSYRPKGRLYGRL